MGSAIPAFMLFPELIKERVSLLEGLCCDYVPLLASQPSLWNKIPSTGAALSQTEWLAEICEARRQLHTAWSSTSSTFPAPADEAVCRVDKRLKVYMSMLRVHRDTPGAVDVVGLGGAGNVLPAKNSANAGCTRRGYLRWRSLPARKLFCGGWWWKGGLCGYCIGFFGRGDYRILGGDLCQQHSEDQRPVQVRPLPLQILLPSAAVARPCPEVPQQKSAVCVLRHEADEDYLGPSRRRLCAENSRRQLPLEKLFDPAKRCGAASSLWDQQHRQVTQVGSHWAWPQICGVCHWDPSGVNLSSLARVLHFEGRVWGVGEKQWQTISWCHHLLLHVGCYRRCSIGALVQLASEKAAKAFVLTLWRGACEHRHRNRYGCINTWMWAAHPRTDRLCCQNSGKTAQAFHCAPVKPTVGKVGGSADWACSGPKLHPMRSLAFDACRRKARMPWKVHASWHARECLCDREKLPHLLSMLSPPWHLLVWFYGACLWWTWKIFDSQRKQWFPPLRCCGSTGGKWSHDCSGVWWSFSL